MTNTSATGGPLVPLSTAPNYDQAFDRFLNNVVSGVVGLPSDLVRPRWQAKLPKQPEPETNWCAIGVMSAEPKSSRAQIVHDPAGNGSDVETMWERTTILATFYGPNAWANAGFFDSGIRIPQNREAMNAAGIGFVKTGTRRQTAELVDQKVWIKRVDVELIVDRVIERVYPVLSLLSAQGVLRALPPGKTTPILTPFDTE